MSDCGTIDEAGFRADLRAISQNDYPPLQLVKLPFNWFVPQTGGIVQSAISASAAVPTAGPILPATKNGNAILVFMTVVNNGPASGQLLTDYQCLDSQGNTYTAIVFHQLNFAGYSSVIFLATGIVGGTTTLSIHSTTFPSSAVATTAIEIGGVTGIRSFAGGTGTVGPIAATAGDLAFSYAGTTTQATGFTEASGWTLVQQEYLTSGSFFSSSQSVTTTGTVTNTMDTVPPSAPSLKPDNMQIVLTGNFTSTSAGVPAPVTEIPLPGPCNFIALVSEAIDEQGQYQLSALIGQQAAAGFIRLNGGGNVWIPVSFVPALIPGYVTTNDNYALNPIQGTGFSAIEAPFGKLEFQPATPVFYSGNPPSTPAGFLLAFVGLSVGVGASTGAGNSSTHAIPTAAGPIVRMKDAGLL